LTLKRIYIAFLLLIFAYFQPKAQSKAFELMLDTLINKSVPIIKVNQILPKNTAVFLDTRSKKEFEISHIANAIWVGYNEFSLKNVKSIPRSAHIITYCSVGYRSEKIGEKLQKAGYKNVNNLWGGIFEWANQSQPLINNDGRTTHKVHAYSPEWGIWLLKGEKVYK
jgi:rhodanese-related sulfurtransferase